MVSFKQVGCIAVVMTVIGMPGAGQSLAQAQEPDSTAATASPREQELREQLKGILQELDDLKRRELEWTRVQGAGGFFHLVQWGHSGRPVVV